MLQTNKNSKIKDLHSLGFNIKSQRLKKNMTQFDVAAYCGVSLVTFQHWERGTTKQIFKKHFDKLKEVLGDD